MKLFWVVFYDENLGRQRTVTEEAVGSTEAMQQVAARYATQVIAAGLLRAREERLTRGQREWFGRG